MAANLPTTRALRPTGLALLAALAMALAAYYYWAGESAALPMRTVPHLQSVPLVLDTVAVGALRLPMQASGFVVSLTHDVAGPFAQPGVAGAFLALLALLLAGWVAVASTLPRTAFGLSMVPVVFLLLSLNTEALGLFAGTQRYGFYLLLGAVGGVGFGLQAYGERLSLAARAAAMGAVVAALAAFLYAKSQLPALETTLQLAAYATTAGALLLALVILWVGIENVRALLWFNSQAEEPARRFGLWPFLAASLLYLVPLVLYEWNYETLPLLPGLNFDPLVLLLPAVLTGALGLRQRAPSYAAWVPYARGAAQLYPLAVAAAAGALAYAFATANTPLLMAVREFTAQALLYLGGAFLLYVLINFAPLIRKRLRVYRVVFEPRRLPFYTVYIMGVAGLAIMQSHQGLTWPNQVQAAEYNNLGDLTRLQSEAHPEQLALALLAERYYAESGDVLYRSNLHAQMGRAALYRFREQRQNELNALQRALQRGPNEKVSVRLAALFNEPRDLFDGLDLLRQGLKAQPRSAMLASDLAQRFSQTSLNDSVAYYLDLAERLAPGSEASRTNQLAFLLQQKLYPAAEKLSRDWTADPGQPALASNLALLRLQSAAGRGAKSGRFVPDSAASVGLVGLDAATFADLYHAALAAVRAHSGALLPKLAQANAQPANQAYDEQLVFLQALTRHALGQELLARQLLAPLEAGTSATARYYQNLLGLWQLQQGQFATAADQLDRADVTDSATRAAVRVLAQQPAGALGLGRPPLGAAWLARAQQAEQQGDTAQARRLYHRLVAETPFSEPSVLAAAVFYGRHGNTLAAYEALRVGLLENPRSQPLLQAYVLAAANAGLSEYATTALAQLREQLSPAAYAAFAAVYAARQAARAAAAASFSAGPPVSLLP